MTTAPETYAAYSETESDPRFTDWLRARAEPAWTEAAEHRFTRELGAGELSTDVFAAYLVQDYAFIDALVSAFGFAVGQAPDLAARRPLVEFLDTLTAEENDYFRRSFDALGVPEARWTDPELAESTAGLVDLLGRAAREGGYAETLAALVPAEWLYAAWATRESSNADVATELPFYYDEWIALHANPEFTEFVAWLRGQLDEHGPALSPRREKRVARIFRRTVDLEVAFFDRAYAAVADDAEVSA